MSNIIPPLLSSTPPPIDILDEDDDEFGDFTTAVDISYGCEALSIPNTPQDTPIKMGINSNKKDYLDKRKSEVNKSETTTTDMPKLLNKVPMCDFNSQNNEFEISSAIVPELDFDGCIVGNQNVPSNKHHIINNESDDFLREEPPEIPDLDDLNDDFGQFETHFDSNEDEIEISIEKHSINKISDALNELKLNEDLNTNVINTKDFIKETNYKEIKDTINDSSEKIGIDPIEETNHFEIDKILSQDSSDDDFGDFETPSISNNQIEDNARDSSSKSYLSSDEEFCDSKNIEASQVEINQDTINEAIINGDKIIQENLNDDDIIEENLNDDKILTKTLDDGKIIQECINDDKIIQKTLVDGKIIQVYINDDKIIQKNLNVDDIIKENLNDDNIIKKSIDDSKIIHECINDDKIIQENLNVDERIEENLNDDNIIQKNLDDVKIIQNCINYDKIIEENDDNIKELKINDEKIIQEMKIESEEQFKINNVLADEDFGDFESPEVEIDKALKNESVDDFGEFSTPPILDLPEEDDDFGDFTTTNVEEQINDDFGDFEEAVDNFGDFKANFPGEEEDFGKYNTANLSIDTKNVLEKSEKIILEMFALGDVILEEFSLVDFTSEDCVFKEVRDLTDTNALTYQWSKSKSQKSLLKALNIDTRNIMYGPGWNSSMPKFAANLSQSPLEPMKPEVLTPTPVQPSLPSTPSQQPTPPPVVPTEIPSAQFDWNGSGLTNPLDSVATETTTIKTPEKPTECVPPNVLIPKQSITQSKQFDTESVNSLQFTDSLQEPEENATPPEIDDFEDFTSFQSTAKPKNDDFSEWSSGSVVPLRETHINNVEIIKTTNGEEQPGWLKPTILTPVMSRKDEIRQLKNEIEDDFTDFQTSLPIHEIIKETKVSNEALDDDFDDFTSFQSQVPNATNALPPKPMLQPNVMQPTYQLLEPTILSATAAEINWPDPGITDDEMSRFEMYSKRADDVKLGEATSEPKIEEIQRKLSGNSNNGEGLVATPKIVGSAESGFKQVIVVSSGDCFGSDFKRRDSLNDSPTPSRDCFGPDYKRANAEISNQAKGSDVHKEIPLFKKMQQNKIFGVTKNSNQVFEFSNVSQHKPILNLPILDGSPRKFVSKRIDPKPKPQEIKQDDDDWTDFVSNQEIIKPSELSLSIPQLSQIQPPKLPIPVITPQGLMQTKIPSMPMQQPMKLITQPPLQAKPSQDGYQPAIISNQFAMQFNQNGGPFMSNRYQTTALPANQQNGGLGFNPLNGSLTNDDNDEWSDFVSSRPAQTNSSNGGNYNNWAAPNIITNPVHYQSFPTTNQTNKNVSKRAASASSAAMPDLDFVAPKNSHRTFQHKK